MNITEALALLTKRREVTIDRARIPELGSAVFNGRELSARERFEVLEAAMEGERGGRINVALWRILAATRGIVGEDGTPLFQGDAAGKLIAEGNEIAARLGEVILDLSEAAPESLKSNRPVHDNAGNEDAAGSAEDPRTED